MLNGAAMTMTVLPGSGPKNVQDPGTNEYRHNFESPNGNVPEGCGSRESLIPKIFPVYAFI